MEAIKKALPIVVAVLLAMAIYDMVVAPMIEKLQEKMKEK